MHFSLNSIIYRSIKRGLRRLLQRLEESLNLPFYQALPVYYFWVILIIPTYLFKIAFWNFYHLTFKVYHFRKNFYSKITKEIINKYQDVEYDDILSFDQAIHEQQRTFSMLWICTYIHEYWHFLSSSIISKSGFIRINSRDTSLRLNSNEKVFSVNMRFCAFNIYTYRGNIGFYERIISGAPVIIPFMLIIGFILSMNPILFAISWIIMIFYIWNWDYLSLSQSDHDSFFGKKEKNSYSSVTEYLNKEG
jgi:hypothetical protein